MTVKKLSLLILLSLTVVLALAGCGLGDTQPGRKPSPDWSRGMPLSADVGGTVGMYVEGDGLAVHLAWPTAADDQAHIHYLQLDSKARIAVDKDLTLPFGRHRTPRLLPAGGDNIHLFWAIRKPNNLEWKLWYALLDKNGDLVGEAVQISAADMNVGDYAVVRNEAGVAYIVWQDKRGKGFWAAPVTGQGIETDPVQITPSGDSPGLYLEEDGSLHMTWREPMGIHYAEFPAGQLALTEGVEVVSLTEIIADLDGPVVGVAGDLVYIVWSIFARSGLESGTGWTEYITFPAGEPAAPPPVRVWMLTNEDQPYISYDGAYQLTVLAPAVDSPALSSDYILEPDTARAIDGELAVSVATKQTFRLDEFVQMAIMIFKEGDFYGYEMAAKTESFSMDGRLQVDQARNLHLAWRDGAGRNLYFASTAPDLKNNIDRLNREDFFLTVMGGGLEAVTGVLFFPLSLAWFVPGALLLGIWKLRKDDETIEDVSSRLLLVVAILLYQATKLIFLPSIISYVPFSAWIDVPQGLSRILQFMVPLLSFGVGLLVAEWARRRRIARRQSMSSLTYFFFASGIDAIITLMIYGVNFLGVL